MFKKVLALTLALVMLLMPMTASAVTWNTILDNLSSKNTYTEGDTTATKDGDTITVSGGVVEDISIFESGKYVFKGVSIQGESLVLETNDDQFIELTLDTNTRFDTSAYGLDVYFDGVGSEIKVHNDTTIVGLFDSLYVILGGENNKLSVDGEGSIQYSTLYDTYLENPEEFTPVFISLKQEDVNDLSAIKEAVQIQQKLVAANGMPTIQMYVWNESEVVDGDSFASYLVDQNGALYKENSETGEWELIDPDFLKEEEEEEEEPDPIEELRQAEGIGGVTTSPVWNWQGYLGHSSKPMWIYVNGEKVLMRQRLFWLGDSTKNHTCRINLDEPDPASVELRIGLDMLRTAQRAEISVISILDKEGNPVAQFAVSDLMGAFEQYGLVEGELLCVSGDADAEVMKVTLDGEYLPLEAE